MVTRSNRFGTVPAEDPTISSGSAIDPWTRPESHNPVLLPDRWSHPLSAVKQMHRQMIVQVSGWHLCSLPLATAAASLATSPCPKKEK